jgi:hypothetical protein
MLGIVLAAGGGTRQQIKERVDAFIATFDR